VHPRSLSHSRREATTDALTGLGNRRQLTADLCTTSTISNRSGR
jgi:GGDEF domain-containing protein